MSANIGIEKRPKTRKTHRDEKSGDVAQRIQRSTGQSVFHGLIILECRSNRNSRIKGSRQLCCRNTLGPEMSKKIQWKPWT